MNDEDKRLIANYMGWQEDEPLIWHCPELNKIINFDLNDVGLCVKEMEKREDWEHDFMDFVAGSQRWNYHQCIAWLFNADNFFEVMAKWLKEEKK